MAGASLAVQTSAAASVAQVQALTVNPPPPGALPAVVFHPVANQKVRIGTAEVLAYHSPPYRTIWAFVQDLQTCQFGKVVSVALCLNAGGAVRYKHPYGFGALKIEDKRRVSDGEARRQAGRGADHSILDKAVMLALAKNPFIVRLKETWHDVHHVYSLMEYLPDELVDVVQRLECVDEPVMQRWFAHMLLGLLALHLQGYAHTDLSCENIMLTPGERAEERTAKVIDFGACKPVSVDAAGVEDPQPATTVPFGKPAYMAPEYYSRQPYRARQLDIWALGVMLFICLCGDYLYRTPSAGKDGQFASIAANDWTEAFTRGNRIRAGKRLPALSAEARNLIQGLCRADPAKRPASLTPVLRHPWVQPHLAPALRLLAESDAALAERIAAASRPAAAAAAAAPAAAGGAP